MIPIHMCHGQNPLLVKSKMVDGGHIKHGYITAVDCPVY